MHQGSFIQPLGEGESWNPLQGYHLYPRHPRGSPKPWTRPDFSFGGCATNGFLQAFAFGPAQVPLNPPDPGGGPVFEPLNKGGHRYPFKIGSLFGYKSPDLHPSVVISISRCRARLLLLSRPATNGCRTLRKIQNLLLYVIHCGQFNFQLLPSRGAFRSLPIFSPVQAAQ